MARRCSDDIDPKREDVARAPRRRKRREQPEPSPELTAAKPAKLARALKRPVGPGIMFEHEDGGFAATAPHSDRDLWELQIADAFGTRSLSVIRSFLDQLGALCSQSWDGANDAWKPNETELSAILAMIVDLQPRNTAEAGMVAQMVAVHLMTLRLSAQALNRGNRIMEADAALAGKLARTYAMQMETYQALRGRRRTTRQSIKVTKELHQHVHYHDHRGDEETGTQPHEATAVATGGRAALPGPEPVGQVVRLPSRKG